MKAADARLERKIHIAWLAFMSAPKDTQREALDRMTELVKQRSPERVSEMERERGLLV